MSVLVRSKRGESSVRRRRLRPSGRSEQRPAAVNAPAASRPAADGAVTAPDRRCELGPLQDQALYTCQCGFVFQAPVSTSVGCPNCGDTQAW